MQSLSPVDFHETETINFVKADWMPPREQWIYKDFVFYTFV